MYSFVIFLLINHNIISFFCFTGNVYFSALFIFCACKAMLTLLFFLKLKITFKSLKSIHSEKKF